MHTRRIFLKSSGLALCSLGVGGTPLFLNRLVFATPAHGLFEKRPILIAIFQRGAMDGLMAVPPVEESHLTGLRPRLAMTAAGSAGEQKLLDLDNGFGLHPAFSPFLPFYKEGRLAIVHGVGSPDPTRSHFDAQDYMETGTPGRKGISSGWLNRACGLLGHEATPFRAVAMTPAMPRSLNGEEPALAISRLEEFGVSEMSSAGGTLESMYRETTESLLHNAGTGSFEAVKLLSASNVRQYRPSPGVTYPSSPLGNSLKQIAQLIKADVGLEVGFAETGGWDTHVQQGTANGTFATRARDLSAAISAFWWDMASFQDRIVLMTMTEFGRTVRENGSGGTDHGRASCSFILGNQVTGGMVHGTIPPLVPEALEDARDLPVTVDFRSLFAEVAGAHLGLADDKRLFPGWEGERFRVMRDL